MNETLGQKAIGKMLSIEAQVTDGLGALARTVSRLRELQGVCSRQIDSLQQAENWFAIIDTVLECDLGILDDVGEQIARAVPGAVYKTPER